MAKVKGKSKKKDSKRSEPLFKNIKSFDNIIVILSLIVSAGVGYFLRAWPLQYNRLLGYDPYFFLREASYYLAGGLPEIDPMTPTVTRYFRVEDLQGLPLFSSFIARITGQELLTVHMYLPIFIGIIGSILIFFVAWKAWNNKYVAAIASFFLAIMPAYIYRTAAGGLWKDTLGSLFFIIFMILAIMIIKEKNKRNILIY